MNIIFKLLLTSCFSFFLMQTSYNMKKESNKLNDSMYDNFLNAIEMNDENFFAKSFNEANEQNEKNCLHGVCSKGNIDAFKKAFEFLLNKNQKLLLSLLCQTNAADDTPLNTAWKKGNEEIFKYLINSHYRTFLGILKFKDNEENRPFNLEYIEYDTYQKSILEFIALTYPKYFWIFLEIFQQNSSLYALKMTHGNTILHHACEFNLKNILQLIEKEEPTQYSTFIETKNIIGETPLHLACTKNYSNLVEYIAHKNSNLLKSKIHNNKNILHSACIFNCLNIITFLSEKYPELFVMLLKDQDECGNTPLHYVYAQNNKKLIEIIALRNKDLFPNLLEIKNKQGHTPIDSLKMKKLYSEQKF